MVGNGLRRVLVAQDLANVVGDEPGHAVYVGCHADIVVRGVEDAVAQLESPGGHRVELFGLGRFFVDDCGQGLAPDISVEIGVALALDFGGIFGELV